MTAKVYQNVLHRLLAAKFDPRLIKLEWGIGLDATDAFDDAESYIPRLDLAVGPFNLNPNARENTETIRRAAQSELVEKIIREAQEQNGHFAANANPRCLLAIEIEFSTSSKHILGGFTNASMMGHVGVLIAPPEKYSKIQRIGRYTQNLKTVRKAPIDFFSNVACFTTEEFIDLLNQ